MKIVQISGSTNPRIGGKEQLVCELIEELKDLGHEITLITCDKKTGLSKSYKIFHISPIRIPGIPDIPKYQDFFRYLNRGFDVCHLHYHPFFGELVGFICKKLNIPLITTFWDEMKRGPHKIVYDKILLTTISTLSDKIICLSDSMKYVLTRRGLNKNKIRVIPTAIHINELYYQQKFYSDNSDFFDYTDFLFVGRLEERKGIQYLLKALLILKEQKITPTLRIIGDGILKKELMSYVKKYNLSSQVLFTGYIQRNKLLKLYNYTQCVIIPSLFEGIPRVALEAMASGKPIIATSIPGMEMISREHLGIIVPPKDAKSLAQAMIKFLSLTSNDIKKINLNAKTKVLEYDWSSIVKNIISVYHECLESRRIMCL